MARRKKNNVQKMLPLVLIGGAVLLLSRSAKGQGSAAGAGSGGGAGSGSGAGGGAGAGVSGNFPDYRDFPGGTWAIINNNPQNILRTHISWAGEVPGNTTPYEMFENMYYGWGAAIENANANIPLTDRTVEGLLRRLHVGSGTYSSAAQAANQWIMDEMRKGGASLSDRIETIQEVGRNYNFDWWWLFHRNNARLEAGTKFTPQIDASKAAFTAAFNDVLNELA